MNNNATGRHGQGGFTLTETLVAMLLMSFVGLIVTGGIAMGARVYGEITERSNAELLLSTTLMRMRDELDRVEEVWTVKSGETTTTYFRTNFSNWRTLETSSGSGDNTKYGVFIREYGGYSVGGVSTTSIGDWPLVTEAMGGKDGLYATFNRIEYKSGYFEVTGLRVVKKTGDTEKTVACITEDRSQADSHTYQIRVLEQVTTH